MEQKRKMSNPSILTKNTDGHFDFCAGAYLLGKSTRWIDRVNPVDDDPFPILLIG
jgi:hypothetical protein